MVEIRMENETVNFFKKIEERALMIFEKLKRDWVKGQQAQEPAGRSIDGNVAEGN